jgi:quinoprotein glucose dehydrogenase
MRLGWITLSAALLSGAAIATSPAQPAPNSSPNSNGDWPTYGHDKGSQRHSPLTQITPNNVATLAPAWVYHMKPPAETAAAPDANANAQRVAEGLTAPPSAPPPGALTRRRSRFAASQVTPLVVNGRMFITTPYGRVVALNPDTGAEIWATKIAGSGQPSQRGVEYWAGDGQTKPRIFFGTRDGRLIALDAATGQFAGDFGNQGVVDLKTPDVLNGSDGRFYGMTSPPIVFENLVITGSAVQEFPAQGASGDVRAWDARSGKLRWTFHSIPPKGQSGAQTWGGNSGTNRSGVNAWGFLTVDAARGIVYMPFGAPSWDRYGGDRPGDNLYGTSLVAADARTGKYLWHFQVVRHDIWDFDLESAPLLLDVPVKGVPTPAVAIVSKSSLLFILNRVTGKPIRPIELRKVPASDTPGEQASPVQPFPTDIAPLGRTSFTMADLAQITPEHTAACKAYIETNHLVAAGLYTPIGFKAPTISFPGTLGGANWGGAAYDPARKLLIINTMDFAQITQLIPSTGPLPYERGPIGGRFVAPDTRLPCQAPPWGQLNAVDAMTGKLVWAVPLGVTDSLSADKQLTGRPNIGGAITTASGLIFVGATDDARFRAFAADNGKMLWEVKLDAAAHATPISYAGANGRQFVVISASGGSFLDSPLTGDSITAFALPLLDKKP